MNKNNNENNSDIENNSINNENYEKNKVKINNSISNNNITNINNQKALNKLKREEEYKKRSEIEIRKNSEKFSGFIERDYQNFLIQLCNDSQKFYNTMLKGILVKQKYLETQRKRELMMLKLSAKNSMK